MPIGLVWCEWPFLELGAPTVLGKPQHPQITPGPVPESAVLDQDADDRGSPVHRQDVALHRELLVMTVTLGLPEPCDRVEALDGVRPG